MKSAVSVLDHFPSASGKVEPINIAQFVVLQISRNLNDLENLKRYFAAVERHGLADVIAAYRRARSQPDPRADFQKRLQQLSNPSQE